MACTFISEGRLEPCKDTIGGLLAVYFLDKDAAGIDIQTDADDQVDDLTAATATAYKFDLKGNSNLTQNINASRENGTVFFEQVLSLELKKMSSADNKNIKLLSYGYPVILVEDYQHKVWMVGLEFGADVTGGSAVTGSAMGDFNGYTGLTFTAMERTLANEVLYTDNGDGTWTIGTTALTITEGV